MKRIIPLSPSSPQNRLILHLLSPHSIISRRSPKYLNYSTSNENRKNTEGNADKKDISNEVAKKDVNAAPDASKDPNPDERPIDVAERLIFEPQKHLTPEQHKKLIESQVEAYFETMTWRDYIFMVYMVIMTLLAAMYFFFLSLTKAFSERYTVYMNRVLDERRDDIYVKMAEYAWRVVYEIVVRQGAKSHDGMLEHDLVYHMGPKPTDNNCEWPPFELSLKALDWNAIALHPDMAQILNVVFGSDSLSDLRFLNSNFLSSVNHSMHYFPIVKHQDSRIPFALPHKTYNATHVSFYFPVINIKTNVKSVLKVTLTTEHDLDRFENQVLRKVPLTEREQEKERLEKEKQEYIEQHGKLKYYYNSWTGKLNQDVEEDAEEKKAATTLASSEPAPPAYEEHDPASHIHGKLDDPHAPPNGLSAEERHLIAEKRLRNKIGFVKFYWRKLWGTEIVDEDLDLFEDNPEDDELELAETKQETKKVKYAKWKHYERLPFVLDDVRLCDPRKIMLDHTAFFNYVPGYNLDSDTFISWPFNEEFEEVPIIEYVKKTDVRLPGGLDDYIPASEEPKHEQIMGHFFLDEVPKDALPKRNTKFLEF